MKNYKKIKNYGKTKLLNNFLLFIRGCEKYSREIK